MTQTISQTSTPITTATTDSKITSAHPAASRFPDIYRSRLFMRFNRAITRADNDIQSSARCFKALFRCGESDPAVTLGCRRAEANSAAFPSPIGRRLGGASDDTLSDAPLAQYDSRLSRFIAFPSHCSDQGADNWPQEAHRAPPAALSHSEGIAL